MPAVIKRQATVSRDLVLDPAARLRTLSDHGSSVQIDKAIPIKRYFRSGSEMERQARVYYSEGQWDRAFMLYNKFATLFIEKLPKHPEYSKAPASDKTRLKKLIKQALPRAMELKEKLKVKYEKEKEELEKLMQEEAERTKSQAKSVPSKSQSAPGKTDQIAAFLGGQGGVATSAEPTVPPPQTAVPPPSQQGAGLPPLLGEPGMRPAHDTGLSPGMGLGSDMGMKQQDSVGDSGTVSSQSGLVSTESSSYESMVSGQASAASTDQSETVTDVTATDAALAHVLPPGNVPSPYEPSAPPPMVTPTMTGTMMATPPAVYTSTLQQMPPGHMPPQAWPPPAQMTSPVAQPLRQPTYESSLFQSPFSSTPPQPLATPPANTPPPPYTSPFPGYQYTQQLSWTQAPQQGATSERSGASEEAEEKRKSPPVVDRTTKPDSLKALNTGVGWGGVDSYRPMYIPADTARRFEELASANTLNNIETCGILAGKLSQNTLHVTHIVVPKQKGQSDSCEMLNEEELFDVQDQYDLITLGWIHTHPTQTAFLSSVDLHCHCSYQIMMDEAVAIVVAPKYQQVGYFMLTEPHGLNYITHCEEEGFHVHPKEPPLFEDCRHVHHDSSMFIQIVDLR